MTFKIGSRRPPLDVSSSSNTFLAALSRYMAAIVAAKSPYSPEPNEVPPVVYDPDLNAFDTVSM